MTLALPVNDKAVLTACAGGHGGSHVHSHEPQNPCQGASASTTPRLADPRRHFHLAQSQSVPQTHQREADLACTLPTHAPIRRATSIHCDATSHSVNLQHHADRRKTILRWLAEESIPKALPSPCRTGKEEARVSGRSLYSITLHVLEEVNHFPPHSRSSRI